MERNARFWVCWNGSPVKLCLRPGGEITLDTGRRATDEGWSSEAAHYIYYAHDAVVAQERQIDGCDCDGRLTQFCASECPMSELNSGVASEIDGMVYPNWRDMCRSQRDYAAESAGY